jgi:hypothetical protein
MVTVTPGRGAPSVDTVPVSDEVNVPCAKAAALTRRAITRIVSRRWDLNSLLLMFADEFGPVHIRGSSVGKNNGEGVRKRLDSRIVNGDVTAVTSKNLGFMNGFP